MNLLFILLLGLGFTQTKLETRVYTTDTLFHGDNLNLIDLDTDLENVDTYIIQLIKVYDLFIGGGTYEIRLIEGSKPVSILCTLNDNCYYPFEGSGIGHRAIQQTFTSKDLLVHFDSQLYGRIKLAITAEFPEEDTGYIEEGYQFCVQPGANLLSFPCDNPISVNQSLPQGAENFITQIVGQGVATTYNPALGWVGSLDNFSPGSGYWFKSNESLCFEYDCVED